MSNRLPRATLSVDEMAQYRQTARQRLEDQRRQRAARRIQAWELARQAAEMLKHEYGVQRVVVFGSLLSPEMFHEASDVDLAAWGLTSANWLRAIVAVQALSSEIELNLVDVECCSPQLRAVIEREGVEV